MNSWRTILSWDPMPEEPVRTPEEEDAYQMGWQSGYDAAIYGDFTPEELADEDAFLVACSEACENKRQYADSPTYDFAREENSEDLFDAFDEGEGDGVSAGYRERTHADEE